MTAPRPVRPLVDRLAEKTIVAADQSECWGWAGSTRDGYGQIRVKIDGRWTVVAAHRVSFEIHVGPVPDGQKVAHTCHDPRLCMSDGPECPHRACTNPAHLRTVGRRDRVRRRGRTAGAGTCGHCGATFLQQGRGRTRRFCSDQCRTAFHNAARSARGKPDRGGAPARQDPSHPDGSAEGANPA